MPRGSRCPFRINPSNKEEEEKKKHISFKQSIDPADPNGIRLNHTAVVCSSTSVEDVLKHELQFNQLQDQLNLDTIIKRKKVYEATLSPSLQTEWRQAVTQAPANANYNNMNLLDFANARERFIIRASNCDRSLAEDTRHWLLYDLKKPRDMAVHDFQKRINEICEYFPIMPRPRDTMPVTPRFATPDDNDKIAILHNACPESWRNEQARTNQMELDLEQLLTYYSTLKSIEKGNENDKRNNHNHDNNRRQDRNRNKKGFKINRNTNTSSYDPICPIHGNHTVSQCELIKSEKAKFKDKKNRRSNFDGNNNSNYRNNDNRGSYNNSNRRNHNNNR